MTKMKVTSILYGNRSKSISRIFMKFVKKRIMLIYPRYSSNKKFVKIIMEHVSPLFYNSANYFHNYSSGWMYVVRNLQEWLTWPWAFYSRQFLELLSNSRQTLVLSVTKHINWYWITEIEEKYNSFFFFYIFYYIIYVIELLSINDTKSNYICYLN